MATIYVDDKPYEVDEEQNLLAACLSLGFDVPYFCWHPAMHSVGACRQCAVKQFKDENDTRGRIVMACMTPASDGTRISIDDPEVRAFRAAVIEWLMLNHPHDCPVCDEGGECHLQDMTVMTGHAYRRYRGRKRTFHNQDLGPLVNHEMNRCIQCYRCVRFYDDYAAGDDLRAFSLHNLVYFGRHESGILSSEFSGNLVEICPTGVFTDKSLKGHYTRKWDLQTAPSVCVHCGLGCNTIPGERYGSLRRIRNRFNSAVNGYFLCDRGRYGYEFVNSEERLRQALARPAAGQEPTPVPAREALARVREIVAASRGIAGVGSPRASLEANFALRRLTGAGRFAAGLGETDLKLAGAAAKILQAGPVRSASLGDVGKADVVLVLGEDVSNFAPLVTLALRQAVRQKPMRDLDGRIPFWDDTAVREALQQRGGPLYLATIGATNLDGIATRTFHAAPHGLARLGFEIAGLLDKQAPRPAGLGEQASALAGEIADALATAERPLVITGTGLDSQAVLEAGANVARALARRAKPSQDIASTLFLTLPEANTMGAALMGGGSLADVAHTLESGAADTLIILENDLFRRGAPQLVDRLLQAPHVIVIDTLVNPTVERAEIALPAATFAESDGTLVNSEGRAQRFFKVLPPAGEVRESWRWLAAVAGAGPAESGSTGKASAGNAPTWQMLDDVIDDLVEEMPVLAGVRKAAPRASFRLDAQKVARQPHNYSGRTAMTADRDVREPRPPADPDSPLGFSMEGFQGQPPPPLVLRYWAPGWNSVQALNRFQQEVGGPLRGGDPGVRLLEPAAGAVSLEPVAGEASPETYFDRIPERFSPRSEEWLIVPVYHVFGSEELSVRSPGVRELSPDPYLGLGPGDAAALGAREGTLIELIAPGGALRLPVRFIGSLPPGVAALPVYLPGLEGILSPGSFARIKPG